MFDNNFQIDCSKTSCSIYLLSKQLCFVAKTAPNENYDAGPTTSTPDPERPASRPAWTPTKE